MNVVVERLWLSTFYTNRVIILILYISPVKLFIVSGSQ